MRPEEVEAYELIEKKEIGDVNATGYLLRHKKTGAKVALLETDDENKVFYIGFRTPPVDSTGSAHIVEHTVLCGSRQFPLKDPFIELAKGSLNTFLNAMTYPDKTVYPVASCNDRDFQNLMHVYLDAVFYPNIYREEKIFRQEGWHYEMEQENAPLTLNGVVYNEMKGAFSSPDDLLERQIMNTLYPDTAYGFESGGDPEAIPTLTYEKFLDFHRRYYHPSNSYIYLYGNMDMAEKLRFIDENYLSAFSSQPVDSELTLQKPFSAVRELESTYPISEGESEKENTYLSLTKTVGDCLDRELYVAFEILDYCLCSAPGAPLRQALIDRGIGKDVYSVYEEGVRQPYFSVIAKNADASQKQEFSDTCREVLQKLATEGLDRKSLLAALNYYEFKYREADFGSYPRGLMIGLQMLDSWLHDDSLPFLHLEENAVFAALRDKVDSGYFEGLIQKYLLDNTHGSMVVLKPEKGLTARKDKELADRLKQYRDSLTLQQKQQIVADTRALKEYQETPDTPEQLACIPHLSRADMKQEPELPVNEVHEENGIKVLFHPIFTNGIGYVRLMFDCACVPAGLFPYIGLLRNMIGLLDTEHFSYAALFNEINLKTGGMTCSLSSFTEYADPEHYKITVDIKTKAFYHQLADAFDLIQEILLTTKWGDQKRAMELLDEELSRAQSEMLSAGHVVAMQRALSYQSGAAATAEALNGITQYRFLEDLSEHFDERAEDTLDKLRTLSRLLFRPENLSVDYTAQPEGYEKLPALLQKLCRELGQEEQIASEPVSEGFLPELRKRNEGFTSASQVQYVALAGNYRKHGLKNTGALKVLKMILGYDYLWNNVRVKGGAYGCMSRFLQTGDCCMVSYRDPHLKETLEIYQKAAAYIREFPDHPENEEKLTQYVIGAIGEADTPRTPQAKGNYGLDCYMAGITDDMIRQNRQELLSVTTQKIRELAPYLDAMTQDGCICALGGEEKVKEDADCFHTVEALFRQAD